MSCKTDDLVERLLECAKELEDYKADLDTWTDSLEELSEIENAFKVDKKNKLHGKTILDVGTDCVKPLYIALKFEPDKIIGINEDLSVYSFASDLEQKSKLLTKNTKLVRQIKHNFNKVNLARKDHAMLKYAVKLTKNPYGLHLKDIEELRQIGFNDTDILNINLITSYFNFINRIALGLGVEFNEEEAKGYKY